MAVSMPREHDIESRCLRLLLRQQPVARDLRQISSALRMISDMERIGDQAADIAEICQYLRGTSSNTRCRCRKWQLLLLKWFPIVWILLSTMI